jgi:hypothetical protein
MLNFEIQHQPSLSRGQLLLRSFFGIFYIFLPHAVMLMLFGIVGSIYRLIAFWAILFTGKHPKSMFDFQVGLMRWSMRLNANFYNLVDEYPSFGLSHNTELITLDVTYPESLSRGKLLLKAFFGVFYVVIPHVFILYFRMIGMMFINFLGFWAILFTGKMPESWHIFTVDTFRWMLRLQLYLGNMTDVYPPFTGKVLAVENAG